MANFDTNSWYQLTVPLKPRQSMTGSVLYNHGLGSVFFQVTNTSLLEQQWQIFPFNSSTYVLRTRGSGPIGYLNAAVNANETTPGHTVPDMRNNTLSDDSMYWQFSPWGDGTFYLTNAANGSDWHLQVKDNSLMALTSNTSAPGQRFSFSSIGTIDDERYSSVITATSTPTGTTSASPTSTSNSDSNSNGLSSGAKAAIGVSIGVVGVIIILVVAFLLLRRKRKASTPTAEEQALAASAPTSPAKDGIPSYTDSTRLSELPTQHHESQPNQVHELDGGAQTVELAGDNRGNT